MDVIDYLQTWKLVHRHGKVHIYLAPANSLIGITKQWQFNRPEDPNRTLAILKSLQDDTYVDSMLYFAQKIGSATFFCYDGNHRRKALIQHDTDRPVLVHITTVKTDAEIKENFMTLNKANPVPEIYLESDTNKLQWTTLIMSIIVFVCEEWPEFQSNSRRPRRPNFNRDNLTDHLYDVFLYVQGETMRTAWDISLAEVKEALRSLNRDYSQRN